MSHKTRIALALAALPHLSQARMIYDDMCDMVRIARENGASERTLASLREDRDRAEVDLCRMVLTARLLGLPASMTTY